MSTPVVASVAVRELPRRRRLWWWAAALAAVVLILPVVLIAGAGNPPCTAGGSALAPVTSPAGPGMFAQPLHLAPGRWYRVGATEYSGLRGSSGALLSAAPDSFAELSLLDHNPYPDFTFADANALGNLPYGAALRVEAGGRQAVLVKRDIGYGQGPGQTLPYRLDIYAPAAARLGVSKTPVQIALAPSTGTGALLDQLLASTPDSGSDCAATGTAATPITPGENATILADGRAAIPQQAPAAVKLAIAAGNRIIDRPYLYGGGHGTPLSELAGAYDCSGATSYLLHAAGLFGDSAETSGQLETFGAAGPGRWITVYANSGHVFIDVAGVVMNTAWYAPVIPRVPDSGPRWQPASSIAAQYAGDLYGGFVQRHPRGL